MNEIKKEFLRISFPKPETLRQKGIEEFDVFHVDRDKDVYFQVYFEIQIHGVKNNLEIYPWVKINMKKLHKILIEMKNQDRSIEIPDTVCNAIPIDKSTEEIEFAAHFDLDGKSSFPKLVTLNLGSNKTPEISQNKYWDWMSSITNNAINR